MENIKKEMNELQLQTFCFQYLWNSYPLTRRCFFHVPNGGSRNRIEGMQLKASGVVAGVPDMCLVWKGRMYGIEFKTLTGTLSTAQKEVHEAWAAQGIIVHVVRSFEQFKELIQKIIG